MTNTIESKVYIPEVRLLRADYSSKEKLKNMPDCERVDILRFLDVNIEYLNKNKYTSRFIMLAFGDEEIEELTWHMFAADMLGHREVYKLFKRYYGA